MKNEQTDSQMASFSCAGRPFSPGRCPLVEMGELSHSQRPAQNRTRLQQEMFVGPSNFSRIGVFKRLVQQNHTRWTASPTPQGSQVSKTHLRKQSVWGYRDLFSQWRAAPRPAEASAWAAAWVVTATAGGKEKR